MTKRNLEHIDISALSHDRSYKSDNSNVRSKTIVRVREEHGPRLIEEYRAAFDAALADRPQGEDGAPTPDSVVLEVELAPTAGVKDIYRKTEKTRQGANRIDPVTGAQKIAFIVPDAKREVLETLLEEYTYGDLIKKEGKADRIPREDRIARIEAIRKGTFETFWQDDPDALPADAEHEMWWALWCFRDKIDDVVNVARRLGARVAEPDTYLHFPDTIVVPIFAPKVLVEIILFGTLGVAEVRRATDSPTVFLSDLAEEIDAFVDDFAERVTWPGLDMPTVCLLGTGVNRAHPLIEPSLSGDHLDAVDRRWGVDDHDGHDTAMAGLALHGDLTSALADTGERELRHRLESVKILPPAPFDPNEPSAYGPITQAATAIAEANNVNTPARVFALPVTNANRSGSGVTAWSSAIDQAACGKMVGDEEGAPHRLYVISAGNVQNYEALAALEEPDAFPAEDPSQAWNALSVGGYTDKTEIQDGGYEDWTGIAEPGELSPYSRTSLLWSERKSPSKPDIVFEAGNRALSPAKAEALAGLPSLSLLSTGADVDRNPVKPFWATSAATALAARMAAQISAEFPDYWPETIRALLVHSAQWTPAMMDALAAAKNAGARVGLIRRFGFGIPSLERALASAQNSLALVAQREIQPFRKVKSGVRFNEAHAYTLPWPKEVLEDLRETQVRLKVTLSHFVEPNPGFSADADPARYQSFGLRFDLKRSLETSSDFLKRRNADEREDGEKKPPNITDSGWLLGEKKVTTGSLHCDIWEGTAAQLASRNLLWVYPVNGWWRERAALNRYNDTSRYALVLSLETDDTEIDLYTPISAQIEPLTDIDIDILV